MAPETFVPVIPRIYAESNISYDGWLERIAGDGACLYRSLAVDIFCLFTRTNFAPGTNFGGAFARGQPDAWSRWSNSVLEYMLALPVPGAQYVIIAAIVLNVLTMWVKFYAYAVLCTGEDIPSEHVRYYDGIVNLQNVVPMTKISELQDTRALDRILGNDGTFYVPTLDLVVRYLLAVYTRPRGGQSSRAGGTPRTGRPRWIL